MSLSKTSILGVSVTTSSQQAILSFLSKRLSVKSTHLPISQSIIQIVTPNPEQIVLAQKNEKFRNILNEADIALPDGSGLVWAMKKKSKIKNQKSKIERISGVDFMIELCRIAAEKNSRVLLCGGRGGVANKALSELKKLIPNLDGIAMDGPEFSDSMNIDPSIIDKLIRVIRSRNIRVVLIGFGAPKQEFLMDAFIHTVQGPTLQGVYSNLVVMVVGGAFDMLAGKVARAPKVVQQIGFEWLWRFIQEPSRWKRQRVLLTFIQLVLLSKIRDN
ncbi:WecB/TagA/CpsF family glycosyltransferase [Patescibacteria group bacterium]|nr:WecB/TagA/CpsF family glycosyltransferase [Patescibacteria group bacterium]